MAKKKIKMVRIQLGSAVTATIGGIKFINGQAIVPEAVAKAKAGKWKIVGEIKAPDETSATGSSVGTKPTKKIKPKAKPIFEAVPEESKTTKEA